MIPHAATVCGIAVTDVPRFFRVAFPRLGGGFRREHLAIKLGDLVLDLDLLPVKFSGFLEKRGEVRHASLCAPASPKIIEADLRDRCALRNKRFVLGSPCTHVRNRRDRSRFCPAILSYGIFPCGTLKPETMPKTSAQLDREIAQALDGDEGAWDALARNQYKVTKTELGRYLKYTALVQPVVEGLKELRDSQYFKLVGDQDAIRQAYKTLSRTLIPRSLFKIVPKSVGALPPYLSDSDEDDLDIID